MHGLVCLYARCTCAFTRDVHGPRSDLPAQGGPAVPKPPIPHQKAVVLGVGSQAEAEAHVVLPLGDIGERYPSFGERMQLGAAAGQGCQPPSPWPPWCSSASLEQEGTQLNHRMV